MHLMTHAHIREEILAFLPNKQASHDVPRLYFYLCLPVFLLPGRRSRALHGAQLDSSRKPSSWLAVRQIFLEKKLARAGAFSNQFIEGMKLLYELETLIKVKPYLTNQWEKSGAPVKNAS